MTTNHPTHVLMCPPDYFDVDYVINPWMEGNIGLIDKKKAVTQWQALHQKVASLASVKTIAPQENLPDMVFTANGALVLNKHAALPKFRYKQRQGEVKWYEKWLESEGFTTHAPPQDFEGEGDALFQPGESILWAGYGVRSNIESHAWLQKEFNVEIKSLRLVDPRFYHLDTCFFPLPDGKAVYFPQAFDERSLRILRTYFSQDNRIEITEENALKFACNCLRINNHLISNDASSSLKTDLGAWGYTHHSCCVDEFLKAGGGVKCLCLLLTQDNVTPAEVPLRSPLATTYITLQGHILDRGTLNQVFDHATQSGVSCFIEEINAGIRQDQPSFARLRLTAPSTERLDTVVAELMTMGAEPDNDQSPCQLLPAPKDGVAPENFYVSNIYPTDALIDDTWHRAQQQRMDAVLVYHDSPKAHVCCTLIRNLKANDQVVCGVQGLRIHTPTKQRESNAEFSFMSGNTSSERHVEHSIEELAWEMKRIKQRHGKIVVVAGPVVIHTGGAPHLEQLIRHGYVQALLTGNALPTHDIEHHMYGTSLGIDLSKARNVKGGHTHHLRAINRVRKAGSIENAVNEGIVSSGIMHACVQHSVHYELAGSIRDDGPLPDTKMDLIAAQAGYAKALEKADMVLMLSTMLHSIGAGNMTPAGPKLICVDINPSVVTKLTDRGSLESTGIITDVGLFLNILARKLAP